MTDSGWRPQNVFKRYKSDGSVCVTKLCIFSADNFCQIKQKFALSDQMEDSSRTQLSPVCRKHNWTQSSISIVVMCADQAPSSTWTG